MTDLFFDTDCISAFLWVNGQSILAKLYPGRIVIPEQVYQELSAPGVSHLKNRLDSLIESHEATKVQLEPNTEEAELFETLTKNPESNFSVIGDGEAAAIALAKVHSGILASNNLRDICQYVEHFGLRHVTTADIMKEAYDRQLITEKEANAIWYEMLKKRRQLGWKSFTEFLEHARQK